MKVNKIILKYGAWMAFAISFIVYLLTMSLTVNFWDCGEIIACSAGLQIGHPPGAPFYMIIARIFSLFAIKPEQIAFFVNLLSVVSCSFAVFFTYKSILILIRRVDLNLSEKHSFWLNHGAALVGSLALAFSSSFWFVATEAEVYSLSIFFTTLTFWTMLKITTFSCQNDKNKWLLLSLLLLGVSTGVHMLNILIIPALVFIFYFDQKKQTNKEIIKYSLYAIGFLLLAQAIISYLPLIASKFEWFFVNKLYLGYNSGLFGFAVLLIVLIVLGIYFSGKKRKPSLNLAITGLFLFIIGFSTYTIILIRSAANPPIDQNNPETIFNFLG
ncbi:MAG: DUF2723 domain-containing protein, partial [Bacteroidales bacterium]|nr:DUF2723 domain-containing protein [Bacteroidales bacterium]